MLWGWAEAVFILGSFVAIMATVTVAAWQVCYLAVPMSIARAEAYRNLAEQSTQAQSRTADWLDQAVTELAELQRWHS